VAYTEELKSRVRHWMSIQEPRVRHLDLAARLEIEQPGQVSNNLSRARMMSEGFIALLQEKLPGDFPGVLDRYLELKHATSQPAEVRKEILDKAERRRELTELGEQMKDLIDRMVRAAVADLD